MIVLWQLAIAFRLDSLISLHIPMIPTFLWGVRMLRDYLDDKYIFFKDIIELNAECLRIGQHDYFILIFYFIVR